VQSDHGDENDPHSLLIHHADAGGNKGVALLISVLALVLAFSETLGKSAQTAALSYNIQASNLWAFYQSKTIRRTTILFYGIVGGGVLVVGALAFNHSGGLDPILRSPFALLAGIGLFVLAGATPAASRPRPTRPRRLR